MTTSTTWATDPSLFQLWDPGTHFPAADTMPDLDVVTHVAVERARPEGYHYLHESAIACHGGALHLVWANHREAEYNVKGELLRGSTSVDGGFTWSPAATVAEPGSWGGVSYNHPVIATHQDTLWGFFTRWDDQEDPARNACDGGANPEGVGPQPSAEIARYDDGSACWTTTEALIPGFIPFGVPVRMTDGNWIVSGERFWYEAAVAISQGDDWTAWEVIELPRPDGMDLRFPETALVDQGDRLVTICRPNRQGDAPMETAPASQSTDCGRTWSTLALSNYPLASSQPFAGTLSTGQHFLLTNNLEEERALISIAVTRPGERTFSHIWKVRHQQFPRRRHFPGYWLEGQIKGNTLRGTTEWSYPSAVEVDGQLVVSYTQGKEDCVVSIIPLTALSTPGSTL